MCLPAKPLLAVALVSTTLIACADDVPDPAEVRTALREDLGRVLREGQAAMDSSTANLPSGAAFGFASNAAAGAGVARRALAPLERMLPTPERVAYNATPKDPDGELDADAIVEQLAQELFTDANYLGNGVYRVPASMVCDETIYDDTTGEPITQIDPECAQQLDQAQLRVRVTSEGHGMRFYIQLSANHDEPLSVFLANDELALTVNLDAATDAMLALGQVFGEEAPNADFSGEITGSLRILGTAHARVALSFDRVLSIKFADQGQSLDGPSAFRFSSAAGKILGVELDGASAKASLDLGLGPTATNIPGDELDPQAIQYAIAGATVNASFENDVLTLAKLSLGSETSWALIGDHKAIEIDLNPNDGRTLDATITVDPTTGSEVLAVSPRLDLHAAHVYGALGDGPPVYDVTRVQIEGALRGSPDGDSIEVLSGSVNLTTNPAQYGLTATAGQCVTSTDVFDDETFTSYTQYTVAACL